MELQTKNYKYEQCRSSPTLPTPKIQGYLTGGP